MTDDDASDGPVVDGDPTTGKLWVRGTEEQIAQVEELIRELEGEDALDGLGDKVRVLPYTGPSAVDALNQAEELWEMIGRPNEIRTISPSRTQGGGGLPERRIPRENDEKATPLPVKKEIRLPADARATKKSEITLVSDRTSDETNEPVSASDSRVVNVGGAGHHRSVFCCRHDHRVG